MIDESLLLNAMENLKVQRKAECELKQAGFKDCDYKFVVSPEIYEILRKSIEPRVMYRPKYMQTYVCGIIVVCSVYEHGLQLIRDDVWRY